MDKKDDKLIDLEDEEDFFEISDYKKGKNQKRIFILSKNI
jgi:hypothetical protein